MFVHFVVLLSTLTTILGNPVDQIDRVLVNSNNLFTANVYKEVLKNGDDNFLISPFSAETALAFAQSGARGETQQELRQALQLPNDQNQIENGFRSLFPKLKSENVYSFHTANKLYLQENFRIKDEFRRVASEVFYSGLENIQFVPDTARAAKTMNKWVEDQTEKKIQNLITPDKLDASTAAILINALYFKGNWSSPFTKYTTRKDNFYKIDKTVNEVDMMRQFQASVRYNYAESEELGAKILELPFQGGDVSMVIVLPNEKDGITRLEQQVEKVFQKPDFRREHVRIFLPKFKTESKIDFKEVLQNLGVRRPFGAGADFKGISDADLFISDVIQKTYIDVNEDGVEAAAATFVGFTKKSGHSLQGEVKDFQADHPFIYYIKVKDLIVFAGRVGLPTY